MKNTELEKLFDIDKESLKKMPEWFKKLREAYKQKQPNK